MSSTLAVSTKIDLSGKVLDGVVSNVIETAQVLGLSLDKARDNLSGHCVEIFRLVDRYNNFESFPIPNPDQCWK